MCDPDCRKRFRDIEINIASLASDVAWVKQSLKWVLLLAAAALGVDVSGVV